MERLATLLQLTKSLPKRRERKEKMELEIKLRQCKDAKCFNFFQKLQVYTVVAITTTNNHPHSEQKQDEGEAINLSAEERQEQRTPVDNKAEDGYPEWNHTMRFKLSFLNQASSIKKLFLHFQLRHHGQFFGDKVLGNVYVPFEDLIPHLTASTDRTGIVRFVDYQVKSPEGKPNGVISFSYKVVGIVYNNNQLTDSSVDVTGYPLLKANQHQNNQDQVNQVGDMEPLKVLYPTIDPVPEYIATTNLVHPSVRPPQPATEYNYNDNLYCNYDPYSYTGGESNSAPPYYPPPPPPAGGPGPPPPRTPRPRSMWEIPRDFYAPLPHFAPPFPQYGPPPHHHHHRPFRVPHPHGWR